MIDYLLWNFVNNSKYFFSSITDFFILVSRLKNVKVIKTLLSMFDGDVHTNKPLNSKGNA